MRHLLVFWRNVFYHIVNWFFFGVSNICSDYFKTSSVWNGKRVFFGRFYSWLFFCLHRNLPSISLHVFPSSYAIVLKHQSVIQFSWLLNICSRGTLLASLNSSIFWYSFLSCRPNLSWVRYHLLWCIHIAEPYFRWRWNDVISNNLHEMGVICKEIWIWDFLIKFSFGWLQILTSRIFGWMIENSLHCAVIVSDDDINDK